MGWTLLGGEVGDDIRGRITLLGAIAVSSVLVGFGDPVRGVPAARFVLFGSGWSSWPPAVPGCGGLR